MKTDELVAASETPEASEAADTMLVALTPAEVPEQQQALIAWCGRKIAKVQEEAGHWTRLEEEAVAGGFRHETYRRQAAQARKRIVYYEKIKAAVEAGYLIVPNMPINVFAVRVGRNQPREESTYRWNRFTTKPQQLPAGEGRYVDEQRLVQTTTRPRKAKDGTVEQEVVYFAEDYDDEIDFPVKGVHPRVLQAAATAKSGLLFDELGVVQNQGGKDPIIVGRVYGPGGKTATFFLAWWLDLETL